MKDLIVLCADKKIEATLLGLFQRKKAIGIRTIEYEIRVHAGRDPGCYHHAEPFLRSFLIDFQHALVVFDRDWQGAPSIDPRQLEADVESALRPVWCSRARAVVIDPELESWVWSNSPHVSKCLGWTTSTADLRRWLTHQGAWAQSDAKPADPKRAVELAARQAHIPWTAAVCRQLAERVSLTRCTDSSLARLREILLGWFGPAR
jgi:hypothetical protein